MKKNDRDILLLIVLLLGGLILIGGSGGERVINYFKNQTTNERVLFLDNFSLVGYLQNENISNRNISKENLYYSYSNKSFNITQQSLADINYVILDGVFGYGNINYKNINLTNAFSLTSFMDLGVNEFYKCDRTNFVTSTHVNFIDRTVEFFGRIKVNISGAFGNIVEEGEGVFGYKTFVFAPSPRVISRSLSNVSCSYWGDYWVKEKRHYQSTFLIECIVEGNNTLREEHNSIVGDYVYVEIPKNDSRLHGNWLYYIIRTTTSIVDMWAGWVGVHTNLTGRFDEYVIRSTYRASARNITIDLKKVQIHYNMSNRTHVMINKNLIYWDSSVDIPRELLLYGIRQAHINNIVVGNSNNYCDARNIMVVRATKTRLDYVPKSE